MNKHSDKNINHLSVRVPDFHTSTLITVNRINVKDATREIANAVIVPKGEAFDVIDIIISLVV